MKKTRKIRDEANNVRAGDSLGLRARSTLALSLAAVCAAFFSLGASSCFGRELEVEFWHSMSGTKGKVLSDIVSDFNREQTGKIHVRAQFVGTYDEGLNKLRTSVIAKRPPQVAQITDVGSALMLESDAIVPLATFISTDSSGDSKFPLDKILPAIRRYYEINGQLYSLPFATSNPVLYYNVDKFKALGLERPPATFAELEAYATRLTDPKSKVFGITWPLHSWFLEEFMAKQGAPLLNPSNGRLQRATEANYLSPAAREFLEMWARMVKNGSFANVGRGWEPAEQNFLGGRAAMFITSSSDIFEVVKTAPFHVATAFLPSGPAGAGGVVVGGNSLWIMKSREPQLEQAAYAFVKYMASTSVQKKWHMNTGYFPIRSDVIDELRREGFYERFPQVWTAIEQMRTSPEMIATQGALTPVFQQVREHIMTAVEEILAGKSDFDTALKKAKAKTDSALTRRSSHERAQD